MLKGDDFKIILVSRDWVEGERLLRFLDSMGFESQTKWFKDINSAKNLLSDNTVLFIDIDPRFPLPAEYERWQKEWTDAGVKVVALAPYGGAGRLPDDVGLLRKPVDFYELEQVFKRISQECNISETVSLRRKVETQYLQIRYLEDMNRQVVDSIPLAVAVLDSRMYVVYANHLFYQMLDLPEGGKDINVGEVLRESLYEAQELLDAFNGVLKEGRQVRIMQRAFTPSVQSRQRFFDIWISRLPTEPRQVLMVMDDVTQFISQRSTLQMLKKVAIDIRGTLDLERVLFTILTCVTAGVAIGFTRAFLLLVDAEERVLRGRMGVGPMNAEEAQCIWSDLSSREQTLDDLIAAYDILPDPDRVLHLKESERLVFSMSDREHLPVAALTERRTFLVTQSQTVRVRPELMEFLGTGEFVVVPLFTARRPLGVVVADNRFSARSITSEQIELLETFSFQAAIAIDTADAYHQLQEKVKQLQQAYKRLEEAQQKAIQVEQLAAVGRMAAKVAHEIRNPLVTIGGFARMIRKSPDDAVKVRSNSYVIVEEVKRLERILSELMDLSRPSPPVLEMFNINRLIDEIALKEKENLQRKGIELVVQTDESIGEIMIDADKIRQVLLNLIRNAESALIEALSSDSEREAKIIIRTEDGGDTASIHIEDTGTGIPEELQPNIFQPFFTTRSSGTGLGLAIAKRIVDEHRGSIAFVSKYGRGAHFVISLPKYHK